MDYHLDTRVILSEDPEHKNLYKWFLREVGESEPKYQRDQIPWVWTQYFTVSEIKMQSSFKLGDRYAKKDEEAVPEIKESDFIRAKLLPYDVRDQRLHSSTRYSMFGTNRTINAFELAIYRVEEGKEESCSAWGSVSYTTDIDFRDVTSEDAITFYLQASPERFERIAHMIAQRKLTGGALRLGDVDGFYSEWSPGISTDSIKVLTRGEKDHPVEIPEGCSIVPPRLGNIGEFELYLFDDVKFAIPSESAYDDEQAEASEAPRPSAIMPQLVAADPKGLAILKSLRIAAWVIAALLVLMLLK